ncbi:iron chelate uptake ABC transporter family permease subunit [Geitlerinema sp. P-1104]|uniref:iron chelate uptake ABC transporter family permease subunit n=1 Tax=Geitlerinema sp. P-1104 TaxID=2546230 RepID=UPI00197FC770|nr:iron chelate uptake ABC transporter family permease subunit [Geitlerinema sp. P-1104]
MIGFVGLIIPHGVRLLVGSDHRLSLPLLALGGAIILILARILTINNTELCGEPQSVHLKLVRLSPSPPLT